MSDDNFCPHGADLDHEVCEPCVEAFEAEGYGPAPVSRLEVCPRCGQQIFEPAPEECPQCGLDFDGPRHLLELEKPPKWDWTMNRIAFLDAETTGTWDPEKPPLPLEIAMIVTTGDLVKLAEFSAVVGWTAEEFEAAQIHPVAQEMHSKSGLLSLLFQHWSGFRPAPTILKIEREMVSLLEKTRTMFDDMDDPCPVVWAGASPSALDRPLIRHYMPEFYSKIHYRTLDISSERLTMLNWLNVDLNREYEATHRALQDCEDAISFARRLRALLKKAQQKLGIDRPAPELPPAPKKRSASKSPYM